MKQIIPFKKELLFKTKVSEITSISLEHNIDIKNEDYVEGSFLISGEYKMTEGSINREKFSFTIPFQINLDSKYDTSSIIVDIDNFYYEVINNEILNVNIDLYVVGDKLDLVIDNNMDRDSDSFINDSSVDYHKTFKVDEIDDVNIHDDDDVSLDDSTNNNSNNIFDINDNHESYVTYYVYIVKEDDTVDRILDKFKISLEELEKYNDVSNIKFKDKLIIPSTNNE